jgi:hypothetical protein
MLTKEPIEFKSIDDTAASPLAQELFKFSYVKEVLSMKTIFQLPNMKSTKEITLEIRSFIKQFIENGGIVLDETMLAVAVEKKEKIKHKNLII